MDYGLVLLFLLVAVESAGVPVPGETALVAAAILARPEHHHYSLFWVIVIAAVGAIVGDNIGYWLGRVGGRRLIYRWKFVAKHAEKVLPPSERFFARHGPKTVFFGRFIALLRVTSAWLAGISRMTWWKFLFWNAAGGVVWAAGIALLAYYAGKAVTEAVDRFGLYGAVALIVVAAVVFVVVRVWRRRMLETLS